jgi:hypothetical protein
MSERPGGNGFCLNISIRICRNAFSTRVDVRGRTKRFVARSSNHPPRHRVHAPPAQLPDPGRRDKSSRTSVQSGNQGPSSWSGNQHQSGEEKTAPMLASRLRERGLRRALSVPTVRITSRWVINAAVLAKSWMRNEDLMQGPDCEIRGNSYNGYLCPIKPHRKPHFRSTLGMKLLKLTAYL